MPRGGMVGIYYLLNSKCSKWFELCPIKLFLEEEYEYFIINMVYKFRQIESWKHVDFYFSTVLLLFIL